MASVRQVSFAGGEVSPDLHSRTDLGARATAARTLRNFIPTATGSAPNRPGFQYVATVKDPTRATRLVPFTFSTSQAYLLEVGHLYIRIFQGGGYVLDPVDPVEVVTTYTEAQLPSLRWVQSGDTLTILHPSHPPRELRRMSQSSWVLAAYAVTRTVSAPTSLAFTVAPLQVDDTTHQTKRWEWVVTAVKNDEESLPSAKLSPPTTGKCLLAADRTVSVQCGTVTGATYNWYRGRDDVYGYVGTSKTTTFIDEGQVPNYSDQPPTARDPFASSEYPRVATYYQQRLVFANQPSFPQRVLASRVGAYKNHDYSLPQKADDAIDFTVASCQYEEIRALVPLRNLIVLTANTEFIAESGDSPLSPTNINLVPVSYNGCAPVTPVIVNGAVLYVQAQAAAVRAIAFDGTKNGWGGSDVSIAAHHLLASTGHTVVAWAFQRLPYGVVWAVRDDGTLLSLTYSREMDVAAWARHDTDGHFEDVCSVPEGSEFALYAIVRRTVDGVETRYIERMATRRVSDLTLACFLDCSVWYYGAPETQFDVSHLGQTASVMALVDGVTVGPLTAVAGVVTLPTAGSSVFIGLPYNSDVELLDLYRPEGYAAAEVASQAKLVSRVIWEVDATAGLSAGEGLTDLQPWVPEMGEPAAVDGLRAGRFVVPIASSWNRAGRAVLRQSSPLPVTILGAERELTVGE